MDTGAGLDGYEEVTSFNSTGARTPTRAAGSVSLYRLHYHSPVICECISHSFTHEITSQKMIMLEIINVVCLNQNPTSPYLCSR